MKQAEITLYLTDQPPQPPLFKRGRERRKLKTLPQPSLTREGAREGEQSFRKGGDEKKKALKRER